MLDSLKTYYSAQLFKDTYSDVFTSELIPCIFVQIQLTMLISYEDITEQLYRM